MNIRNVLRAFTLLRQLTDDESALLATLRGMSEAEQELLVESLSPEKPVARKRKSNGKRRSDVKCSERLTSLAGTFYICKERQDHVVHDQRGQHPGYHEFKPRDTSKSQRASSLAQQIRSSGLLKGEGEKGQPSDELCQKEFPGGFTCNEPADANVHHLRGATGYHEFVAGKPNNASTSTEKCSECDKVATALIHADEELGDYHPFASSSTARNAAGRLLSKNGSPTESGASSEIDTDAALVVAGE